MILELFLLLLGVAIGYGLGTKDRRKAILAKLNELTAPKKEPAKPEEKKA